MTALISAAQSCRVISVLHIQQFVVFSIGRDDLKAALLWQSHMSRGYMEKLGYLKLCSNSAPKRKIAGFITIKV